MEFPKDEVKNKVVWTKGADFTDGSPRYTFEDATPPRPMNDFRSLSIQSWSADMHTTPGSLCNHYYGYVRDDKNGVC